MELMVERDGSALAFFQERLQRAVREDEIEDLLTVFLHLAHRGALEGRKEVWDLLKTKVILVKTLKIRRSCLYSLHQIEQQMKYKSFFFRSNSGRTTDEQRLEEFRSLPLEAQLELCFFTMSTEPPHREYADYLAKQGSGIIPILIAVLKTDYYERVTAKIFYLIELLSQKGALCGRHDVLDVLKDRADIVPGDKEVQGSYKRILDAVSHCQTSAAEPGGTTSRAE
jgi:hypothetical protein